MTALDYIASVTATVEPGSTAPLFRHLYQQLKSTANSWLDLSYTQPTNFVGEVLWIAANMVDRRPGNTPADYRAVVKIVRDGATTELTVYVRKGVARVSQDPTTAESGYIPKDAPSVFKLIYEAVQEKYSRAVADRLTFGATTLKSLTD